MHGHMLQSPLKAICKETYLTAGVFYKEFEQRSTATVHMDRHHDAQLVEYI